jgi:hypothetical protein
MNLGMAAVPVAMIMIAVARHDDATREGERNQQECDQGLFHYGSPSEAMRIGVTSSARIARHDATTIPMIFLQGSRSILLPDPLLICLELQPGKAVVVYSGEQVSRQARLLNHVAGLIAIARRTFRQSKELGPATKSLSSAFKRGSR